MKSDTPHAPRDIPQVMVSSTFTDLKEHRAVMIAAIHKHKLHANVMEHDDAKVNGDVIDSSLQMVRDCAAYILVIGFKYGQTPACPKRNPKKLSVTELEFDEALRLGRPILLFIMDEKHPITKSDIEPNKRKEAKLNVFRERAKKMSADSSVHRVYSVFNSLEDFQQKIGSPLSLLCQHLDSQDEESPQSDVPEEATDAESTIPKPPIFYAEPDYIGSHQFVGRQAELDVLSDWANRSDPTNILLFEAIGGNGKSMLTWEWTTQHATSVRPDLAGRFWYSFYERGAIMQDFCQRALAYMTGRPLKEFEKQKTAEMREELIAQLHGRPWLIILDGLERVLVAYHRIDAAEVPDEEANAPTDKILHRNPCDAIRDEDSDILRALAACAPSKILVSSRLTPRALLNPAGQPISGAKRITLPGLRPVDAEKLLRSGGITGDSVAIQDYLRQNCDNHPLVIGILAGLINKPGPNRGNFDAWSSDPQGGASLDLGKLDLIQRRNHILMAAIAALPDTSRQLLSILALLSESVDYKTLEAFNPHSSHDNAMLAESIADLEGRGLLQYDSRKRHYDLHPVVRGVASSGMKVEERQRYGQRVVDHFSAQPHNPYKQAQTMEDLSSGLHVVRTLLKLGHFQQAADAYRGDLAYALIINLEAYTDMLSMLRPFFPSGWGELPNEVETSDASYLANCAAVALDYCGELTEALAPYGATLRVDLETESWIELTTALLNICWNLVVQNLLATALRVETLSLDLAIVLGNSERLFKSRLALFTLQARVGQWEAAEATWRLLNPIGRHWSREVYRQGDAEVCFAFGQFWQGTLEERHLRAATTLAKQDNNRHALRSLHRLRGSWRLEQYDYTQAIASFQEAVRMARERHLVDADSESGLALAKFYFRQLNQDDARSEVERLAQLRQTAHRYVAMLWLALDNDDKAKHHALAAYHWAWANGEPYVNRYELTKTTELLQQMNVPIPKLPSYDPDKDEPFPWEADVRTAIEKLRAKEAKKAKDS